MLKTEFFSLPLELRDIIQRYTFPPPRRITLDESVCRVTSSIYLLFHWLTIIALEVRTQVLWDLQEQHLRCLQCTTMLLTSG